MTGEQAFGLPKISQIDIASIRCSVCKGEGWVCENHPKEPWNYGDSTCCGGAGMPCSCNFINNFN